ncbi:MAG: diguanylate cyclase [Pelosinus sp.]|nr:diguanylate cyclase [Pelosinus sp.]
MQNKNAEKTNLLAPKLTIKKLVLAYTLLSILLFVLGDKIIFSLSMDNQTLFILQSMKNCLLILLSAAGLYYLLNLYTKTFLEVSAELQQCNLALSQNITVQQQNIEKLNQLSLYDKTTGLTNRTFFELQLERLQDTRDFPVGVIVCDAEYLKLPSDIVNHAKALSSTISLLKKSFTAAVSISRIGSSEFIIFFKNTSLRQMQSAADALQESEAVYNKANPALPINISMGLAISEKPDSKLQELFYQADYAMYCDKTNRSKEARELFLQAILIILQEHDTTARDHFANMQQLIEKFARACGLSAQTIQELKWLATFHDIGKIGIPHQILSKQGRLTPEELSEIKKHSSIGYKIARVTPSLMPIADLINKHHEWWNGQGYPLGLKEEQIPLECRLLSIVEAFDTMTSDHPYRSAMPVSNALQEIEKCAGTQFDPDLAKKFLELMQ